MCSVWDVCVTEVPWVVSGTGVWSGDVTCGCCSAADHSAAVRPEPEPSWPPVPPLTAESAHPSATVPSGPSSVNQTCQEPQFKLPTVFSITFICILKLLFDSLLILKWIVWITLLY